jgi:Uma2 family endonuclease
MNEIVLPDAKPALEWVNNRVLQKVSPQRRHALAEMEFASALGRWARDRGIGMVGTEWRFQVRPPGEIARTLVPDVAYLSYERMPIEELEATETPAVAPDVVVEVRSPDDRQADIDEKVRVYRAAGTRVIYLIDPNRELVELIDEHAARTLNAGLISHATLPGFSLDSRVLFEMPQRPGTTRSKPI